MITIGDVAGLAVIFAFFALIIWFTQHMFRKELAGHRLVRDARNERIAFQEVAAAFGNDCDREWPHRLTTTANAGCCYLMINLARDRLRYVALMQGHELVVVSDYVVALRNVVSVELQQNKETVLRVASGAAIHQSSTAGRALVGALIAGPAGAFVGAASRRSRVSATNVSTTYTQSGPVYLIIGTSDFERPVIKMEVGSLPLGEEWLHRIRAALLLASPDGQRP